MVDIVMPVYQTGGKREALFYLALDSILRQTFKAWTLYVIDDCSPVKVKLPDDKRIIYRRNKRNLKLPGTLNVGHKLGKKPWVFWNADDDWKEPTFIENMLDFAVSNGHDLVRCYDTLYDRDINFKEVCDPRENTAGGMSDCGNLGMGHLYKRELFDRVGGYDRKLFCIEDLDFFVRVLEAGASIGFLEEYLSCVCRHPECATWTGNKWVGRAVKRYKEKHGECRKVRKAE